MLFKEFTHTINGEKSIKNQIQKHKNKKVLLYGAGSYSQYIFENFDLSGLNVVGIVDRQYEENSEKLFCGHKTFSPEEIQKIDFDVILIAVWEEYTVFKFLKTLKLKNKQIDILIKPEMKNYLNYFLSKFQKI